LLVGYCEDCAVHVARHATRRLAAALASILAGVALATAIPIVFPWAELSASLVPAFLGALLPLATHAIASRRPGHASNGRAVFFLSEGELACLRRAYAEELAASIGAPLRSIRRPRRVPWPELLAAVAVSLVGAPVSFAFQHPELRILNLGDVPIDVYADGHALGRVEPSTGESPLAGLDVRVPAGFRELVSLDPGGQVVARVRVAVYAGSRHLYAPGGDACFWLEKVGYGRDRSPPEYTELTGSDRFWAVPDEVRSWFVPNAEPGRFESTTGGTSTALRQRSCSDPPL
jgi:hypothetical protein